MLSLNYRCYMKSFFRIISGLFLLALMSACGGGGGSPGATGQKVALFTSAPSSINVLPGQSQSFTIGGGVPDYTVATTNVALTATVSGTTLTINAPATTSGTFNVVVTDHAGTQVTISVIVGTGASLKTSAASNVGLLVGAQSAVYSITGGTGIYTVVSNNQAVANVLYSSRAGTFMITGVAAGSTTVTVTDSMGSQVSINVTVGTGATFYTSSPSNVSITVGSVSSVYQIGGGSGVYNVSSSSSNVRVNFFPGGNAFSLVGYSSGTALVSVTDTAGSVSSTFQVGGGSGIYFVSSSNASVATASISSTGIGSGQFFVTGLAQGTASIVVSDSAGVSLQLTVSVGSSGGSLVTSASTNVNIAVGASVPYKVQGGTAPYSVGSSNNSVATATITGGTLTVTGVAVGQATLTVLDSSNQSTSITVQVGSTAKLFTTAPNLVTLGTGTVSATFTIGGGSQIYLASSSNNSVATVSLNGNNFIVSGIAAGTATINITDTNGTTVPITVNVTGASSTTLFTTAPTALTIAAGGGSSSYSINGGTLPYSVVSSNTNVLSATLNGSTFQLTGNIGGTATLTIKDAAGISLTPITVTVSGGTSGALYTNSPAAVQISIGSSNAPQYQISGGVAPYSVVSSATAVVTVNLSGSTYTVTGVSAGTANVIITDSVGTKVTVAVTVGSNVAIPFYTSTPSVVTLTVGQTVPSLFLGGGTAPYIASSSNNSVVTVSVSGNSLILTPVSSGTATVQMVDSGGSAALATTVTVVNSNVSGLAVAPASVSQAYVGDVLQFTINGGSGSYTVISNNPSSVTIGSVVQNANNSTFTATMAKVNTGVSIVVTDSKGTTIPITISSIVAQVSSMSLTPVAWSILDNNNSSVGLTLNGGVPPFQIFSTSPTQSNVALLSSIVVTNNGVALTATQSPFFSDRTLTVNLGTQGTRCTNADVPITFTVKDTLGASATSTMTIKTGGTGC